MSGKVVIEVENLSKLYRLGSIGGATLREDLGRWWARRRGRPDPYARVDSHPASDPEDAEFWALREVSFQVHEGEVLGVIGRNGAGKSTLLKILSRITTPTMGRALIRGRVGSLLEVGTGFHPELTGRENIYLNGAILGMSRAEITRKLGEIVEFSEMSKFIDTPVKRYSSGMTVRLAFAVAAHLEPEILIVDEVLAVGDLSFQKKCLGKMKDVAGQGRTVLFVSHNMSAVQTLCPRSLLLASGQIAEHGSTASVIRAYRSLNGAGVSSQNWKSVDDAPGNEMFKLAMSSIAPLEDSESGAININSGALITLEFWNLAEAAVLNLSLHLRNDEEVVVFNALPLNDVEWLGKPYPVGRYRVTCQIPPRLFNSGRHSIELLAVHDQARVICTIPEVLAFEVEEVHEPQISWYGRFPGAVRPRLPWRTELIEQGVR